MLIVIVGAGAVGYHIAKQLINENKDVVLIEKDPERAKYVSSRLDCSVLHDNGNSIDVLKSAGIEKADFFISVTDSDEVNMITCGIVSSEFSVPYKIARIRNLEYIDTQIISKKFLGIDYIVNPEVEASKVIAQTVNHGAVSDVISFEKSDIQVRNILITKKSIFCNKSIKDIRYDYKEDFLIIGILRNEEFIIPSGNTIIKSGDKVYIVASTNHMELIFKNSGISTQEIKKILIVGGGKIGSYVLDHLYNSKKKIAVIESNYTICKELSEKYPDTLIINADITDETIFEEEQIQNYDLIITITNNQELNILTAIYAKKIGTKRAISLVVNNNYLSFSSHLGIDSAVSPKSSSVDSILKFIRRGNVSSVHSIFNGLAEVFEFTIEKGSPLAEKPIKEFPMPKNSLIIGITRNEKNHIPDGNFVIKKGDIIIAIALKDVIHKIENMFEV